LASFGEPLKVWEVWGPLSGAANESHPNMRLKWGCGSGTQIEFRILVQNKYSRIFCNIPDWRTRALLRAIVVPTRMDHAGLRC